MEQSNSQQLNKQLFSDYTANPSRAGQEDAENVGKLLEKYPYCQILQSVYSYCLIRHEDAFTKQVEKASIYSPDRELLFKIIHRPDELFNAATGSTQADQDQKNNLINEPGKFQDELSDDDKLPDDESRSEISKDSAVEFSILQEEESTVYQEQTPGNEENTEPVSEHENIGTETAQIAEQPVNNHYSNSSEPEIKAEQANEVKDIETVTPENDNLVADPQSEETNKVTETELQDRTENNITLQNNNLTADPQNEDAHKATEAEVQDQTENKDIETVIPENDNLIAEQAIKESTDAEPDTYRENASLLNPEEEGLNRDDTEELILYDVVSNDFFAFEQNLEEDQSTDHPAEDIAQRPEPETEQSSTNSLHDPETNRVVVYDDDKLPYSFLWWLDKTRKKHADTYQPYLNVKAGPAPGLKKNFNDLNQQIIQSIFSFQSPFNEEEQRAGTDPEKSQSKEESIIQKFINEEPQIRPPQPEKADNENKARKSSEDTNDLVSETLAVIYTDQMLFHRAIDTYKKLSLKFPEKSTYFADQIQDLDKKLNRES